MIRAILVASITLPIAYSARRRFGTWLAPGALFAVYWTFAVMLPLILAPQFTVSNTSIAYVLTAVGVFAAGTFMSPPRTAQPAENPRQFSGARLRIFTIGGALLTLAAAAIRMRAQGFSAGDALSLEGLLNVGNSLSVARYGGRSAGTQITSLMLSFGYAASITAPHLRALDSRLRIVTWAPIASCIIYSIVTTERLVLLTSVAFTIGGTIYSKAYLKREYPKPSVRTAVAVAAGALATAAMFVAIAMVRVGRFDLQIITVIFQKLQVYAFGYLAGFSSWLNDYLLAPDVSPGWGTATLSGVEYLSGIPREATRSYGLFLPIDDAGSSTNIFTIFRSFIYDFTEPGAIIAILVWGLLAGMVHRRVTQTDSPIYIVAGAGLMALLLLSNIMSIFTFTNVVVSIVWSAWALTKSSADRAQQLKIEKTRLGANT